MNDLQLPKFRLSLLGRFELTGPDGAIDLPNKKLAGLLAYLACTQPIPQHREKLATMLWGSHFETQARQNLRQALSRLRRVLGHDVLLSDGEEVSLAPGAISCDATQLEVLVGQGTLSALTEAVALYKSHLLIDIGIPEQAWSEWLGAERARLEGLALDVMVKLGELELQAGFSEKALVAANKAIAINNLREDAHRLAIRALAAAGRRADALKRYEHLVALLKSELDVEPDASTQALVRSLRQPNRVPSDPLPLKDAPTRAPAEFPALPDRPSIAVLPFDNMSGDPEQEYFADGMVEDILTALSRIRWLFVIARHSSFAYKGRAVDVKQIGRELGVRYVTEGSVRKSGNRVRVTAQLIDAETGAHLWADRFDGTLEDVFQLQDNVASSLAGVIEPTLQVAEHRRSVQRPTDDLTAYDLFLQARVALYLVSREGGRRALELAELALERDPNYGSALAVATRCHSNIYACGWTNELKATRKVGIELARRALRVAADDPFVIANAAISLALFGEDIATTIALVDHSLQLNPNFALGWHLSAQLRLWAGQYDLAIEHIKTSIRLNPLESRHGSTHLLIGMGHFFARRTEKAVEILGLALQENSEWPPTLRFLASSLAHLGRRNEAQEIVKRLRAITLVVIPAAEHWRVHEDREYYLDGLRLAAGISRDEVASR